MSKAKRWQPTHFRRGCWVESYRRSNGATVKRHWRNGHHVTGHFSFSAGASNQRSETGRSRQPRPQPIVVTPVANHAAVAIALEAAGRGRAVTRRPRNAALPQATLAAVSWTKDGQERRIEGITAAVGLASLPPETDTITLQIRLEQPDGANEIITLDAPCFMNADGSLTVTPNARVNPELVNHALSRMGAGNDVKQRNRVRQRLGNSNPEQAMQHALADTFTDLPLPDLPITQQVSIALPDAGYTITVERFAPKQS